MDIYLKAVGCVLISLILYLTLSKDSRDMAILLSLTVCCTVLAAAVSRLEPVVSFFSRLAEKGKLDTNMLETLLKTVGIGLLAEISALVCEDAGNAALGKALKLLGSGVILWLSVPMFEGLLELIGEVLVL